jgi:hypothetical protein
MLTAVTITGPDADLLGAVGALRDGIASPRLPLVAEGVVGARRVQADLLRHLDDYLIPRLRCSDGPVYIAVGGSTGVGKSTLVNSLIRQEVTKAGVLRPTTRSAVLCVNPVDIASVTGPERLLPAFLRAPGRTSRPDAFTIAPHAAIPAGVTLIDSPDVNSVVTENREAGERLLAATDAWLLVTTAERYADAVPWRLLKAARERRVTVAIVLNRIPPEALREVREAAQALLKVNGLGDVPVFTLPESVLTGGLLPEYLLDPLLTWLRSTAHDPAVRRATIGATVNGLFDELPKRLGTLAEALERQAETADRLRQQADVAYSRERAGLHDSIAQGEVLRGTPLLEWQAMIEPSRAPGLFAEGGRTAETARGLLLGALADQIAAAAARAADQVADDWRDALDGSDEALAAIAAGTRAGAVPPELEEWADGVTELLGRTPRPARAGLHVGEAKTERAGSSLVLAGGSGGGAHAGAAQIGGPHPVGSFTPAHGAPQSASAAPAAETLRPSGARWTTGRHAGSQFFAAGPQGPATVLTALVLTGRRGGTQPRRRRTTKAAQKIHPATEATRLLADTIFGADEADRLAGLAATSLDTVLGALFDRLAFRHHRALADLGVPVGAGKALLEAGQAVQRAR